MPDTDETVNPQPDADAAPAQPAAVTREDFDRMRADFERTIAENQRQFNESLRAYAERLTPQRSAEPTGELTEEQIQSALDEGRMTQVQAMKMLAERTGKRVVLEHVEPLRKTGVAMMSGITRDMAGMSTVETDGKLVPKYPHARRFEKEIKEQLDQVVQNGMAVTPEVYDYAYRLVIGGHVDTIANEREEAAVRRAAQPKPVSGQQPARTGRSTAAAGASPLPAFEELFADNMAALEAKGISPDQFARRLGYENAAAYVKMSLEA
jgi:hypothetical protein